MFLFASCLPVITIMYVPLVARQEQRIIFLCLWRVGIKTLNTFTETILYAKSQDPRWLEGGSSEACWEPVVSKGENNINGHSLRPSLPHPHWLSFSSRWDIWESGELAQVSTKSECLMQLTGKFQSSFTIPLLEESSWRVHGKWTIS